MMLMKIGFLCLAFSNLALSGKEKYKGIVEKIHQSLLKPSEIPRTFREFLEPTAHYGVQSEMLEFQNARDRDAVINLISRDLKTREYVSYNAHSFILQDDSLFCLVEVELRHKTTGKSFKTTIAQTFFFDTLYNRVSVWREYIDTASVISISQPGVTFSDMHAIVRNYVNIVNAHEFQKLGTLYSNDIAEVILEYEKKVRVFPDFHYRVHEVDINGSTIFVEWSAAGSGSNDSEMSFNRSTVLFSITDQGKIIDIRNLKDDSELFCLA